MAEQFDLGEYKPKFLQVDSIEYQPDDEAEPDEIDEMPTFRVTGTFLPTGQGFVRDIALEMDGRDADITHVSGLDLNDAPADPGDVWEELFEFITASQAYCDQSAAYHSE